MLFPKPPLRGFALFAVIAALAGCSPTGPGTPLTAADPARDGRDGTMGPFATATVRLVTQARVSERVSLDVIFPSDSTGNASLMER